MGWQHQGRRDPSVAVEPWMTRRKEMEKLSTDDPRYQNAAQIADAVLSGQMPDPTAGATHFLTYGRLAEARRFPAVMGAWRGTANWQAYLLLA
jgi:hypothetical protein